LPHNILRNKKGHIIGFFVIAQSITHAVYPFLISVLPLSWIFNANALLTGDIQLDMYDVWGWVTCG